MFPDLDSVDPRFVFECERARHVAFPLGGIASGGFAVSGSGRLIDWSIANRPGLGQFNGYSHFAIKAERDGKLIDARVLNGPFDGTAAGATGARPQFDGFGHGANRPMLAGLPHFRGVSFVGRFPTADLVFTDPHFPAAVRMTALSPFIPHEDRDSSMPAAMFAFEVVNTTDGPIDVTLAGTLGNYRCGNGVHDFADGILRLASRDNDLPPHQRGDVSIGTDAQHVEHLDYHYRGQWFDDLSVFWREFARPGPLPSRRYEEPRANRNMYYQPEHATLGARISVPPGERRVVRFVIAWHYPQGEIYWYGREKPDGETPPGGKPLWRNYYATQWKDSAAVVRDALDRWDELAGRTLAFRDALFGATLPPALLDAASSTLALLRTTTVLRLDNGTLWGWEGQHALAGSCEGSCTHVWNYQQALPWLFPALERSLRDAEWTYNQQPDGGLTFRQRLPLGSALDIIGPAADGHFGAVIKTFREWKLSGDDAWMRRWWPQIRRAVEYAWSPDNPDKWDPDRTGILHGRQHHTLDMELFGPNAWLSSIYVAALAAAAEMGRAAGDVAFADECAALSRKGREAIAATLFNGRYFVQRLALDNRAVLAQFDNGRAAGVLRESVDDAYWSAEHGELKYQVGNGCLTDQILGQWFADVSGLGSLLDKKQVTSALSAVFENNFRTSLAEHVNPARVYGFEDEGGLLLCTWPEPAAMPMVPAPYAEEVWTGLEYASASHMLMLGLEKEALTIVTAARDRYDGSRRNPYSDIECGSYYARSLSAWALVNAWSGLDADLRDQRLSFKPRRERGVFFWSAGGAWGRLVVGDATRLEVLGGRIALRQITVGARSETLPLARELSAGETWTL
jgi:uncharacterized protein (DUF608 family)